MSSFCGVGGCFAVFSSSCFPLSLSCLSSFASSESRACVGQLAIELCLQRLEAIAEATACIRRSAEANDVEFWFQFLTLCCFTFTDLERQI